MKDDGVGGWKLGDRVRVVRLYWYDSPGGEIRAPGRTIKLPVSGRIVKVWGRGEGTEEDAQYDRNGLRLTVLTNKPDRVSVRVHPNQLEHENVIDALASLAHE